HPVSLSFPTRRSSDLARGLDDVLELLLAVLLNERGALERTQLSPDADRLQIVHHALAQIRVGRVAEIVPCVEPVGISGFGQKLRSEEHTSELQSRSDL